MSTLDKVLYTARVSTTAGGREGGHSKSDDGHLDITHTAPGKGGGSNPEQLFAAGWSACFIGALKVVAERQEVTLPEDLAVDAEVDLGQSDGNFGIGARLDVKLPGMDQSEAQALVDAAHQVCPYSRATRGNIPVEVKASV
ncbi:MAG: organic hydroperoxide resistance protein [Pseudoxanthomonas suwonensis]|nr:organic hydroperoxide resistance protein [Pseudoxanthomonas suwonensis]